MQRALQLAPESQPGLPPACPLAALPEGVLEDILLRSGLHTRQLCRAFRAIHPPLRSLAPNGIDTPEELAAALAALPPSITFLDLRHAGGWRAITPAVLATLRDAVPHLQRLTLADGSPGVLSSILDALHHLPHLHTLHVPHEVRLAFSENERTVQVPWPTLLQAPIASRLRSLTLPMSALDTLRTAPSGTFPQLSTIGLSDRDFIGPIDAGHLASLLGPAPSLRHLSIEMERSSAPLTGVRHLPTLAVLTSLQLHDTFVELTELGATLPCAVGTLTGLRALKLPLRFVADSDSQHGDWPRRLTLLTRLDVQYGITSRGPLPVATRIISQLVQAAVALPQLQDLRLGLADLSSGGSSGGSYCCLEWLACGTAHSVCRQLATATHLRRLWLHDLLLPPAEACLLSCLQGLTSLCFELCEVREAGAAAAHPQQDRAPATVRGTPAARPTHWIADLTELRELTVDNSLVPGLVRAAARLPHLHTLVLSELEYTTEGGGHLLEVLDGLRGVLVRLELGMLAWVTVRDAAVLRALGSMTCLRVLSLCPEAWGQPTPCVVSHWFNSLMLPRSLTRCYLPTMFNPPSSYMQALCQLRVRYPWVSFKPHHRPSGEW